MACVGSAALGRNDAEENARSGGGGGALSVTHRSGVLGRNSHPGNMLKGWRHATVGHDRSVTRARVKLKARLV